MKLMRITLVEPIRNDEQVITDWKDRVVLLNPKAIESVGWIEGIGKAVVRFTSGTSSPVAEDLDEVQRLFEEATK